MTVLHQFGGKRECDRSVINREVCPVKTYEGRDFWSGVSVEATNYRRSVSVVPGFRDKCRFDCRDESMPRSEAITMSVSINSDA